MYFCKPGYVSRGGMRRFTCPLTGIWPMNTLRCTRKSAPSGTFSTLLPILDIWGRQFTSSCSVCGRLAELQGREEACEGIRGPEGFSMGCETKGGRYHLEKERQTQHRSGMIKGEGDCRSEKRSADTVKLKQMPRRLLKIKHEESSYLQTLPQNENRMNRY